MIKDIIIISLIGIFVTIGVAAFGSLNSRVDRSEDKVEYRLSRVEDKIDKQSEDLRDLSVAIGRIEEKLSE
jgi:hypothetical protein